MIKKYDVAVVIGRFQPCHSAHVALLREAAKLAKDVVVIVGSAYKPRTYKNPFSFEERAHILKNVIATEGLTGNFDCRFHFEPNIDTIYNDAAWVKRVQGIVSKYKVLGGSGICIVGHKKDDSSYYLEMFPQWDYIDFPLATQLSATDIRDLYFRADHNMDFLSGVVPTSTLFFLHQFAISPAFKMIIEERAFIEKYKSAFASLPYPPIFSTADAIVLCSGHVLMIKRRAAPGKGLWAVPGGFVNAKTDKSVQDAAIRELREETGIKVPAPVLVGSIKDSKVFDAIDRSDRGRTITHAFKIVLPDGPLPKVKGSDDAEKAIWVPLAEIKSEDMFDDHWDMIQWSIGG